MATYPIYIHVRQFLFYIYFRQVNPFPLLHSVLRNHVPLVDVHSHIAHLPYYSHNPQASFCRLYNNTPQIIIYSHIPQTTWSQEKSHLEIYF